KLAPDLPGINADPSQIERMLMNLAANARDAMPDGGRLGLETEFIIPDAAGVGPREGPAPGPHVLMRVWDTGQGVDPGDMEHLFEPFFTTKEVGRGSGLGLSMVYGIVTGHGGHIACHSALGQGTVFEILFPALDPTLNRTQPPPPRDDEDLTGRETLLLVDDEKAVLETGREILLDSGYRVETASSGEEALKLYEKMEQKPDLVILDLGMPGMGGHHCFLELKKMTPEIKTLIVSGYSAENQVKKTLEAGAGDYIPKPYRLRDLLRKVRRLLDA
ncbi:MAG: response regulator, partial [Pseudomonadota bacterium]